MKSSIARGFVAGVAVLAVAADAFLLFVRPQLMQAQSAAPSSGGALGASSPSGSSPSASGADSSSSDSSSSDSSSSDSTSSDSTSGSQSSALKDGTYTSVSSPNEYGEVQLEVTVKGGRIDSIVALTYPNHTQRSQSISAQAIPELANRAIGAQSSQIEFVSGATETSTAFANSLQDAINQALNAQ